jgi:hypothetical protein
MRDVDRRGHAARVVKVVDRTAAAERRLSLGLVVQLHRQTDHLVALLDEQRRSHGRVHAARHGDHNSHDDRHESTKSRNAKRSCFVVSCLRG